MTTQLLLAGLGVGALAAFPLGPVGMLCLQRAVTHGPRAGIISASAIALASAVWCVIALQGFGLLAGELPLNAASFRLVLGLILTALAIRNLVRSPAAAPRDLGASELATHFVATLLLVTFNPLTLVTVAALLAAFGIGQQRLDFLETAELAVIVLLGGLALWLGLAAGLAWLSSKFGARITTRVQRPLNYFALALGVVWIFLAISQMW